MISRTHLWTVWTGVVFALAAGLANGGARKIPRHDATRPVPRAQGWWRQRHDLINARMRKGNVDLLFVGDSITHFWEREGIGMWRRYYSKRKPLNFGVNSDRTQHVLWRLENAPLDKIAPKVVVLMIGTNNTSNGHTPKKIADGIQAIVQKMQTSWPKAKILLLGIFPKGSRPNRWRDHVNRTNRIAKNLHDGKTVHYMDIGSKFMDARGRISATVMYDYLHLSAKGYGIWAQAIEPKLAELLGEKKKMNKE